MRVISLSRVLFLIAVFAGLGACALVEDFSFTAEPTYALTNGASAPQAKPATPFAALLEETFEREARLRPQWKTQLGIPGDNDRWDDVGAAADAALVAEAQRSLTELAKLDRAALSEREQLYYDVFKYRQQRIIAFSKWQHLRYPITQFYGVHAQLPAFLINQHQVKSLGDAEDYLRRLESTNRPFDQTVAEIEEKTARGVLIPAFMVPQIVEAARNVIAGAPFSEGADSPLLEDFKRKVGALEISQRQKDRLIARAQAAMRDVMKPAYERLIAAVDGLKTKTTENRGVHALDPSGGYYQALLENITTVSMDPQEIHALGLRETKRLHNEMNAVRRKVGFKGNLMAFFDHLRTSDEFYYPDTNEGREAYIAQSVKTIRAMEAKLPQLFLRLPKAQVLVKPVEKFREVTAGKAFYSRATPDGSRPAVYYANMLNMRDLPKYEIEALTFHEAVPGHHLQISIANELEDVPRILKFSGYTAYSEGWGLYSEQLGKEVGFYQDPYSEFGRLAMELWRAARLVVDTGIHAKGWSHEKATQWLIDNTPNDAEGARKAVDRYFAIPGQATAYMIGQLKILELRDKAKKALGKSFDIRDFHDVVLRSGPVPLPMLERMIDGYIASKKAV